MKLFRGYREINKDLTQARRNVNFQENIRRSASVERTAPASFYKSVVGTRYLDAVGKQDYIFKTFLDQQREEVLSTIQKWLEE